jgi:hypothetical protein
MMSMDSGVGRDKAVRKTEGPTQQKWILGQNNIDERC